MAAAIESEIRQLKLQLESDVAGQYEILTSDVAIVQIKFKISNYRILTCVAQIPQNYPTEELLIELKSKYFSPVLVKRLTSLPRVTKWAKINFMLWKIVIYRRRFKAHFKPKTSIKIAFSTTNIAPPGGDFFVS